MSTTYFVAPLMCRFCGVVSPANSTTVMTSRLLDDPRNIVLHLGDEVTKDRADIIDSFISLRDLPTAGPLVVLEEWYCASCGSRRFAHVIFDENNRIASIETVELTRIAFDAAHLTYEGIAELYEVLVGEPFYVDGIVRADFPERVRAHLPAGPPGIF